MKKFLIGILLVMNSVLSVFAQQKNIIISGQVLESDSKIPVELATVQLLSLPDSAQVAGVITKDEGLFSLPKVSAGKYILKVSFVGYHPSFLPLNLLSSNPNYQVGVVELDSDAIMLGEALVTAEAPPMQSIEDTLVYNSAAYRTSEGAMLEELVKKLPGVEIEDDGTVKINGKEVKKIMVNGKEFFGGDVKTGLKNLPVSMIDKLTTYDKKSDIARLTGIDDGEEETVLDLKVKKGMDEGWFGNLDAAGGTHKRYSGKVMVSRFIDNTQFSILGSANNVNDQSYSSNGRSHFRKNQGLNDVKMLGVNYAQENEHLETGGSARFSYRDADVRKIASSERFLQTGNSFSNSNEHGLNKNLNVDADFRLEWNPDSMNNFIFRPKFSYGNVDNTSLSYSATFDADPFLIVTNPNDYLKFVDFEQVDPLEEIRLNGTNTQKRVDGQHLNAQAVLQYTRKFKKKGRTLSVRGMVKYGDRDNDQFTDSEIRYYQLSHQMGAKVDSVLFRNQFISMPTTNYTYMGFVNYNELLWRSLFLQLSYRLRYTESRSDKGTFDLNGYGDRWNIHAPLPDGYQANKVDSLSKSGRYQYVNHDVKAGLKWIGEKYKLSVGADLQPQYSKLAYSKGDYKVDTIRRVLNVAPDFEFNYRFSKESKLKISYRGRSQEPEMEQLLPITDNSNPLNEIQGNQGLKPSFMHTFRFYYKDYNINKQRTQIAILRMNATQNGMTNSTIYNPETGGTITRPENIDGNWNMFAMYGISTALKNKKFTINSFTHAFYNNVADFLYEGDSQKQLKNKSTELRLFERLNGTYRNDWFEFSLLTSFSYAFEQNKLRPEFNQQPYTFSYGASTNIMMPWKMSFSTNISNYSRRGYHDKSMNRDEWTWNAQIAQSFLKEGAATISLEFYDILRQQSNITRKLTASMRSVSEFNGVNSYCMLRFIYRLNIFGDRKAAAMKMERSHYGSSYRHSRHF